MRTKEVLYDSETLLRLVDSEIEELRADPPSNEAATVSSMTLLLLPRDSEQQTEAVAEVRGPAGVRDV
jgi:hypothetical protein